jgi:hypothetical protein
MEPGQDPFIGGATAALEAFLGLRFPDLLVDDLLEVIVAPTVRPPAGWA